MAKKKNIIRVVLFVAVVGIVGAIYAYKEFNRKPTDTATAKADFTVSATGILDEYSKADSASTKMYSGKLLQVEGVIKEITKDEKGLYTIALGDTTQMSSVRCSIDSVCTNKAASLAKGQKLVLKGICSGYNADELLGSDLFLVRCSIN
jgi:hypothetical protein